MVVEIKRADIQEDDLQKILNRIAEIAGIMIKEIETNDKDNGN